jgi:hypothetical protein
VDNATAENSRAALFATNDETMADREISKRTARSLANGSDDRSAPESSNRNQLIALGLIVLGLIMLVATVFVTGDACEQRTIVQKFSGAVHIGSSPTEQKRLPLDDPVGTHVRRLHPRVAEVTTAQLLPHTAVSFATASVAGLGLESGGLIAMDVRA